MAADDEMEEEVVDADNIDEELEQCIEEYEDGDDGSQQVPGAGAAGGSLLQMGPPSNTGILSRGPSLAATTSAGTVKPDTPAASATTARAGLLKQEDLLQVGGPAASTSGRQGSPASTSQQRQPGWTAAVKTGGSVNGVVGVKRERTPATPGDEGGSIDHKPIACFVGDERRDDGGVSNEPDGVPSWPGFPSSAEYYPADGPSARVDTAGAGQSHGNQPARSSEHPAAGLPSQPSSPDRSQYSNLESRGNSHKGVRLKLGKRSMTPADSLPASSAAGGSGGGAGRSVGDGLPPVPEHPVPSSSMPVGGRDFTAAVADDDEWKQGEFRHAGEDQDDGLATKRPRLQAATSGGHSMGSAGLSLGTGATAGATGSGQLQQQGGVSQGSQLLASSGGGVSGAAGGPKKPLTLKVGGKPLTLKIGGRPPFAKNGGGSSGGGA